MTEEKQRFYLVLALAALALGLSLAGALIMTDAGQILRIGKKIVVGYFRVHGLIMAAAAVLTVVVVALQWRWQVLRRWQVIAFVVAVLGGFIATKYATPYVMFPSKQHSSVYRPVAELDGYLEPDDTVYVLQRNGVVRAFPQKLIWQAHIFGEDFGGDDVVFTYCVLTNLPVPYLNDLDGKPMSLRVLAQTNNNLLLWDTRSGEIIQQITSTCELSRKQLEPLPVVEMHWQAFQSLHPEGQVAYIEFSSPLERIMDGLMPLEDAHGGDRWMFRTVNLDDDRVHSKEKIIGVADGSQAVAYTREYLRRVGIENVSVGDKRLVLAHLPEHDVIVAFDRMVDGEAVTVLAVDYQGNTEGFGRLQRAFIFNGPMWAVWAHYYPETALVQ